MTIYSFHSLYIYIERERERKKERERERKKERQRCREVTHTHTYKDTHGGYESTKTDNIPLLTIFLYPK